MQVEDTKFMDAPAYLVTGASGRAVYIDAALADLAADRDLYLRREFERLTGESP